MRRLPINYTSCPCTVRLCLDQHYPQEINQCNPRLGDLNKCTVQIPLPGLLADPEFHHQVGPARLHSGELKVRLLNILVRLLLDATQYNDQRHRRGTLCQSSQAHARFKYVSSPAESHPCSFSPCDTSDDMYHKQATSAGYSKSVCSCFPLMMEGLISCSVGLKEEPHDTCSPSFGTDPLLIPRSFLAHSLHCVHDPYCGPLLSRSAHATVSSLQWGNSTLGRS